MSHSSCILIFGGTFDPPHRAHLVLPPMVADQLGCGRIIYIPTSANPLKEDRPTPAEHRLAMLRLALAGVKQAEIDTLEIDQANASEPSYTVQTLEILRSRYPADVGFRLLMGADAALSFPRWRAYARILELATPMVMLRPPWDEPSLRDKFAEMYPPDQVRQWMDWTVPLPIMDISATEIRRRLIENDQPQELIPPAVLDYVHQHNLYQKDAQPMAVKQSLTILANDAKARVTEVTPDQLRQQMQYGSPLILDVREPDEWQQGHIDNAMHLPRGILERDIENTCFNGDASEDDLKRPIVTYCGGGSRSALAAEQLQKMGFENVASLKGGYKKWRESEQES